MDCSDAKGRKKAEGRIMITSESIFANGVRVGRIVVDTTSREIAFLPTVSPSKLPAKDYASIDEMRNAIIAAYQDKDQGSKP